MRYDAYQDLARGGVKEKGSEGEVEKRKKQNTQRCSPCCIRENIETHLISACMWRRMVRLGMDLDDLIWDRLARFVPSAWFGIVWINGANRSIRDLIGNLHVIQYNNAPSLFLHGVYFESMHWNPGKLRFYKRPDLFKLRLSFHNQHECGFSASDHRPYISSASRSRREKWLESLININIGTKLFWCIHVCRL